MTIWQILKTLFPIYINLVLVPFHLFHASNPSLHLTNFYLISSSLARSSRYLYRLLKQIIIHLPCQSYFQARYICFRTHLATKETSNYLIYLHLTMSIKQYCSIIHSLFNHCLAQHESEIKIHQRSIPHS